MIFLLITIAVIAFVAISIKTSGSKTVGGSGKTSVSWLQFQSKGRDSGFNIKEIKLLQDLAKRSSAQNPAALFWSQNTMDTCIKDLVTDLRAKKILNLPENQDFLSRLFEFRKKMELEKPRYKNGITGSREISTLQTVQVVVQDYGIFYSKVLAVNSLFINLLRPDCSTLKLNFKWKGQHVLIYFWRKDDAGYCFESDVAEEVFGSGEPQLKITHAEKLIRTQTRKSLRMKTHRPASIYSIGSSTENGDAVVPSVKCFLEDVSDGGCSVTVGGKADVLLRVIVQFTLDNMPLSISGMVRSIEYDEGKNTSLLHIESDLIPDAVKNMIFGLMFGAIVDDFDSVPIDSEEEQLDDISTIPKQESNTAEAEAESESKDGSSFDYHAESSLTKGTEQKEIITDPKSFDWDKQP